MNKIILAFICVAFILMLTGCQKKKFNDAIYDTIGQKIEMDIHKKDPTQFTILRYIDNPPCISCQLKLGEWKVYYKKMKKMFGDKVGLYFLTETKNIENAKFLFKIYGFDNVSVVDSSMNFYKTHNLNPILGKDVVFLLDSTNIILTIGNPIENLKIDSLFNSVIFDHLSKKGHSVNL